MTQHWKDLVEGYNFVVESFSNGIHMEKLLAHKIIKPCVLWGPRKKKTILKEQLLQGEEY